MMSKIKDEFYVKAALAMSNLDIEKIEKSQRAEIRMISSSAYKVKSKYMRIEDPSRFFGESEAANIKMYETHIPGFCYTRSGEYRQWATTSITSIHKDAVLCSEKVKELVFTNNELDIEKVMCLHLLGTHVYNRKYIQRKDGRVCSFVKSTLGASKRHTLEIRPIFHDKEKYLSYYNVLPKYVLDIQITDCGKSGSSIRTSDYDTGSDDDWRPPHKKLKVPIFINNEIKVIINSVIEALESVNSPKLNELINLAHSPEELRNMLQKEFVLEYMFEVISHPMIIRATSYDYVFTHPMFDKIPDTGTMESIAQVLEMDNDDGLHILLGVIRKTIAKRYTEIARSGSAGRRKSKLIQDRKSLSSFSSNEVLKSLDSKKSSTALPPKDTIFVLKYDNRKHSTQSGKSAEFHSEFRPSINFSIENEIKTVDLEEFRRRFSSKAEEQEIIKYDFRRLSNAQRILVGLKVAELKSKSGNAYPFETRKKIDMAAIVRSSISDDKDDAIEALVHRFGGSGPRISDPMPLLPSRKSSAHVPEFLEGLTRAMLARFRQEIAVCENKKKVIEFLSKLP